MKTIKTILASLALMIGVLGSPLVLSATVHADNASQAQGGVTSIQGNNTTELMPFIKKVINILLFLLGAIAVLMIIYGGIRYVVSGGDSSQTKAARDTILYAVIGLVVALMAFAIVNFVLDALQKA